MTTTTQAAEQLAIDAFKADDKVKAIIAEHPPAQYDISYGDVDIGGGCGVVGCEWKRLVSMVITSKAANARTSNYLAEVSGMVPDRGSKPIVKFVSLTPVK